MHPKKKKRNSILLCTRKGERERERGGGGGEGLTGKESIYEICVNNVSDFSHSL